MNDRLQIEINQPKPIEIETGSSASQAVSDHRAQRMGLTLLSPTTAPTPGLGAPQEDKEGVGELFGALWRRENPTQSLFHEGWDLHIEPTDTEAFEARKAGYSPIKLVTELKAAPEVPSFLEDVDNEIALLTARTPLDFQRTLDGLYDEYRDRQTIEEAHWTVSIPMSVGVGILDPLGGAAGFAAGAAVRTGVSLSRAGRLGAARTYVELTDLRAAKARYLTKQNVNAKTKIGLERRASAAKKIDDIDKELASLRRTGFASAIVDATVSASAVEIAFMDQPGRTMDERIANIIGSVALSGILAGVGSYGGVFLRRQKGISEDEMARARAGVEAQIYETDSINPIGASETVRPAPGTPEALDATDRSPVYVEDVGGLLPDNVDAHLRDQHGVPTFGEDFDPNTVNYAQYLRDRTELAKKYTGVDATLAMKFMRRLHPGLRMKTSVINYIRDFAGKVVDADYVEAGSHTNGRVRNVETVDNGIKTDEAQVQNALHVVFARGQRLIAEAADKDPNISYHKPSMWAEFNRKHRNKPTRQMDALQEELITYIAFRDTYEASPMFKGLEKEIKTIAEDFQTRISKPWEKKQLDSGVLKTAETPEGSAFYLTWRWDIDKIDANQPRLEAMVREEMLKEQLQVRLNELELAHIDAKLPDPLPVLTPEIIAEIEAKTIKDARGAVNAIRGNPLHLDMSDVPAALMPGSFRATKITHTKAMLEFRDMNLGATTSAWIKTIAPEVRLQSTFGNGYSKTLAEGVKAEIDARTKSLNMLLAHYRGKGDDSTVKDLQRELKQLKRAVQKDVADMQNTIKVLRNEFGRPDDPDSLLVRAGKAIRMANFVTKLGGMTPSSMVDPAYLFMKAGLGPSIRALGHGLGGWPSVRRGYNQLESEFRSRGTEHYKEFRNDGHILGIVGEIVGNSRADAIAMVADPGEAGGKFNTWINTKTQQFSKLTLMSRWNDWMKTTAQMAYTLKVERAISDRNMTFLADVGISEVNAKNIRAQWKKHGVLQEGKSRDGEDFKFVAPNMREWHLNKNGTLNEAGHEAQTLMTAVLRRAVDSTIVGPGVGDIPFAMRESMGKWLFQFQTFPIAIMSRVIIPTMQRAMPKTGHGWEKRMLMAGFNMAVASLFGGSVWAAKVMMREGPKEGAKTLGEAGLDRFMWEGIERSGVFGVYQTILNITDDVTDNAISRGLAEATPWGDDWDTYQRGYVSRSPMLDAATVNVSTYNDVAKFIPAFLESIARGEAISYTEGSAGRRLTPTNNLFYLQYFWKVVQDHAPFVEDEPRSRD